jgi:hypothetical protein
MSFWLHNVQTNYSGFEQMILLYQSISNFNQDEKYVLDMEKVNWFEGNMCAVLGALLHWANASGRHLQIKKPQDRVLGFLQKNHFAAQFWPDEFERRDYYDTTIEYKRFERCDTDAFKKYVAKHFVGQRKGLPQMSSGLSERFRESIGEVFENAVQHSETKLGIFACGQYFPNKKRLDFCIVDLGIGIRKNIYNYTGHDFSPIDAIDWALAEGNTTKRGRTPGGLGLKLLREFIELNQGRMSIISDAGYWELTRNREIMSRDFPHTFPGTVVNIEINTADNQSYALSSEVDRRSIF